MSVTGFIRRCLDAGLSLEHAMAAAEAFEAEVVELVPAISKGAARTARWREKRANRASQTSPRDAGDDGDAPQRVSPAPPSEITPFPPLKGGTSPKIPAGQPAKPKTADGPDLSDWTAKIWQTASMAGRRRSGQRAVERALRAAVKAGQDPARIAQGLEAYYASPDATKEGGKFAKGVDAAISSGRWLAFAETEPINTPKAPEDPWQGRMTRWELSNYWDSDWGPKPGQPGCKATQPQHAE